MASPDEAKKKFERDYCLRFLKIVNGNVSQTARLAGRNRGEFCPRLRRHQFRPGGEFGWRPHPSASATRLVPTDTGDHS